MPLLASPIAPATHPGQYRFRTACSRVRVAKGSEQRRQVFQYGYTRFAFQCLSPDEAANALAFHEATMAARYDLRSSFAFQAVSDVVIVILDHFLDRTP